MFNKVLLIGRLGKDPELTHTPSGTAVCKFSVATNSGFGDKKTTDWHSIVAWAKTAEACEKYLNKGSLVAIEGRIQYRTYEDKEGNRKHFTDIVANDIKFLDPKSETSGNRTSAPATAEDEGVPF